jgi:hypothetical protein
VRAVKAVQLTYKVSDELASLFEDFRLMCNDAIRIALQYEKDTGKKVRSRFKLISRKTTTATTINRKAATSEVISTGRETSSRI